MKTTGNNKTFKTLTGILLLLLVGLGVYTIKFYNTVQDNAQDLVREKEQIAIELRDMLKKYESEQVRSSAIQRQLVNTQDRVKRLLDSLAISQNTRQVLRNYRSEMAELREQRDALLQKNDSLSLLTTSLQDEKNTVSKAFDSTVVERDSLRKLNEALQEQLSVKAAVAISKLKTEGVIVRRSGTQLPNSLAKRIDNIKICYNLEANFIPEGLTLYTQIIAPGNNVLGDRKTIRFGKKMLMYSAVQQPREAGVKKDTTFCQLIQPNADKFDKGIYHINIFRADSLVASTLLQLD